MKRAIKKIIPKRLQRFLIEAKNRNRSTEEIFTEIYEKNLWGEAPDGRKFCSGLGTTDENVEKYIGVLKDFIDENKVESIFEIGCGDFSIMKSVIDQSLIKYTGSDVVKNVTDHLSDSYGNELTKFLHMDAIKSTRFPSADLCIIRQVLQHLNNDQISEIIRKTEGFKYVVITEHIPLNPACKNGDKSASGYIRLQNLKTSGVFLDAPPFSLKCKTLLSYRQDDIDHSGKSIPAVMLTSLIVNS
jgi:hypothetical protein